MFSELLSNSGEKIFLQAIDQFFDLNMVQRDDSQLFPSEKAIDFDETEIEASLENLNVKFCESLDSIENDSTELDSEESISSELSNKKNIFACDVFNISGDVISREKLKLMKYYSEQVELVNKVKERFFQKNLKEKKTHKLN